MRVAAVLFSLSGIGFGACAAYGMWSLAKGHGVPTVMGFPSYGGGPFERIGLKSTVPLLGAFLLVCVLEVVAGVMVWHGLRAGAWLGYALLVPGAFFWWGFALPFGPALAAARSILTWVARDRLV